MGLIDRWREQAKNLLGRRQAELVPEDDLPADVDELLEHAIYDDDREYSLRCLVKATKLGSSEAYFRLGNLHLKGTEMPQDLKLAMHCFLCAADLGHMGAQFNMGVIYGNGIGVAKDMEKALFWIERSARQGHRMALNELIKLYRNGIWVPQDPEQFRTVIRDWCAQGDDIAQKLDDILIEAQKKLENDLLEGRKALLLCMKEVLESKPVLLRGAREAIQCEEWTKAAACLSHPKLAQDNWATISLAILLWEGRGIVQDTERAIALVTQSAERGDPTGQYIIGKACLMAEEEEERGMDLLRSAAAHGSDEAPILLIREYIDAHSIFYDGEKARGLGGQLEDQVKARELLSRIERQEEAERNRLNRERGALCRCLRAVLSQTQTSEALQWGIAYATGQEIPQDMALAATYFVRAAKNGNTEGQYRLASLLENGFGVSKDAQSALYWYRCAANNGHVAAQYHLGCMYEVGYPVEERSVEKAIVWYQKAAQAGHEQAKNRLKQLTNSQKKLGPPDTASQTASVPNGQAQLEVGIRYATGDGMKQDMAKAAFFYREAAQLGNTDAQYRLACLLESGRGVEKDLKAALYWYMIAANGGNHIAQYNLGCMYEMGYLVAKNMDQAVRWYGRAAQKGHAGAKNRLHTLGK